MVPSFGRTIPVSRIVSAGIEGRGIAEAPWGTRELTVHDLLLTHPITVSERSPA